MDRNVKLSALALTVVLIGLFATLPHPPSVAATPLTGVTALAAGWRHTCALKANGDVVCWGANFGGQLGDGTTTDRARPVTVDGLHDVVAIDAGSSFTCALIGDGTVRCWGDQVVAQDGSGGRRLTRSPAAVSGLPGGIEGLSAGFEHACAFDGNGTLYCWGDGPFFEAEPMGLIAKVVQPPPRPPEAVGGLDEPIVAVAAGRDHTCALTELGKVACWGFDILRNGGPVRWPDSRTPVNVEGLPETAQISAGSRITCALTRDGRVFCWGRGVGAGTDEVIVEPVEVVLGATASSVEAGPEGACALLADGDIRCWGTNRTGQLGDGTRDYGLLPVRPDVGDLPILAVSAGNRHTCAVIEGGGVWCWGDDTYSQLGDVGTQMCDLGPPGVCSLTPVEIQSPDPGDIDCDGAANAIDATLVLQAHAGLLTLPHCGNGSDINHDGVTNSIDAALLLQFEAGLLEDLPA